MSRSHLVLVPGLLCDQAVWEHQAKVLRRLTSIEIGGHDKLDSLGEMAKKILESAPERFAIAGHSMGAKVALEAFRRAPERIAGIALLDSVATALPPEPAATEETAQRYALLEMARKEGMRAMGAEWVQKMVHPDRLSDTRLIDAILDMIERKTPAIFAAQIKALLERPDAMPLLSAIECPSLLLCGRQDSWSPLAGHEEMVLRIHGGRLVVVEECGHMSSMERPAEVTAALSEWLGQIR